MSHYLGIDVSTTATKALIMDESGGVASIGSAGYDYARPRPRWTEQDPGLWWDAAVDAIAEALEKAGITGSQVSCIGLTGQMHGMVLLDEDLTVLRPAILWNDQRTEDEVAELTRRVGRDRLLAITGNPALTGFTAPKVLWTRNHEPDVWERAAHLLLPKDYLRLRLSGTLATDRAGASGTSLLDLEQRDWSREIIDALAIPISLLAPTFEGPEVNASVSVEAAAVTGLAAGTPIVAGSGDQAANGVGVGAVSEGVVAISLGTSGVVFTTTSRPRPDSRGRLHAFCHAVPDAWHLMGVMLSAAGSYRWLRDSFAPRSSFEELDGRAAAVSPGSEGLVFLPYLTGERTPHADANARAAFVGLTVRHGIEHAARAVLEGVAFGLRDGFDLIEHSAPVTEVRMSGGGAASPLWRQIIADVLGHPVHPVISLECAAHGAALLAAVGDGSFVDAAEACEAAVSTGEPTDPSPDAAAYGEVYRIFRDLYPALREPFHRLSESGH